MPTPRPDADEYPRLRAPVTPSTVHPCKYSTEIIDVARRLIRAEQRRLGRPVTVLDCFAGVGRVHQLAKPGEVETVGVEIEPEWAACHPDTICADSLAWMRTRALQIDRRTVPAFDVVLVSPVYGNRMSDHHAAKDASKRHGYAFALGRQPAPQSSATLGWGSAYWNFHAEAYRLMLGVLRRERTAPGGLLLLNVSNFVKAKAEVPAVMWHRGACHGAGFVEAPGERPRLVGTSRMRHGENGDARSKFEVVLRMRRP